MYLSLFLCLSPYLSLPPCFHFYLWDLKMHVSVGVSIIQQRPNKPCSLTSPSLSLFTHLSPSAHSFTPLFYRSTSIYISDRRVWSLSRHPPRCFISPSTSLLSLWRDCVICIQKPPLGCVLTAPPPPPPPPSSLRLLFSEHCLQTPQSSTDTSKKMIHCSLWNPQNQHMYIKFGTDMQPFYTFFSMATVSNSIKKIFLLQFYKSLYNSTSSNNNV